MINSPCLHQIYWKGGRVFENQKGFLCIKRGCVGKKKRVWGSVPKKGLWYPSIMSHSHRGHRSHLGFCPLDWFCDLLLYLACKRAPNRHKCVQTKTIPLLILYRSWSNVSLVWVTGTPDTFAFSAAIYLVLLSALAPSRFGSRRIPSKRSIQSTSSCGRCAFKLACGCHTKPFLLARGLQGPSRVCMAFATHWERWLDIGRGWKYRPMVISTTLKFVNLPRPEMNHLICLLSKDSWMLYRTKLILRVCRILAGSPNLRIRSMNVAETFPKGKLTSNVCIASTTRWRGFGSRGGGVLPHSNGFSPHRTAKASFIMSLQVASKAGMVSSSRQ